MKDKKKLVFVGLDFSKEAMAISIAHHSVERLLKDWLPGSIGLKFAMKRDQRAMGSIGRFVFGTSIDKRHC